MKTSLIYSNIYIYRLLINILYGGKYKERFKQVSKLLHDSDNVVLELCFGDLLLAEFCLEHDRAWHGVDINEGFVSLAKRKGFNAQVSDLVKLEQLPKGDVCIMMGSLYQFYDEVQKILSLMLQSAKRVIISEPIHNLSSQENILGRIARISADAGNRHEKFRYTKDTFIAMLDQLKGPLVFRYQIINPINRDIVVVLEHEKN